MNSNNTWKILEKLSDPVTPAAERKRLLEIIENDPALLNQWKACRVLQQWPQLENVQSAGPDTGQLMHLIKQDESIDNSIKRVFPYVAAAALAASLILAFVNIAQVENTQDITIDDVFGLPTPTIENSLLANL